jgi:hypothetical protein
MTDRDFAAESMLQAAPADKRSEVVVATAQSEQPSHAHLFIPTTP